jgi:hypothetical protein
VEEGNKILLSLVKSLEVYFPDQYFPHSRPNGNNKFWEGKRN